MRTSFTEMVGTEFPIVAFSHCRDVVAAASNAGGLGVFGTARFTPGELEHELTWLDEHIPDGKYGLDVVIPASHAGQHIAARDARQELVQMIPPEHTKFVETLLNSHGVPPSAETKYKFDTIGTTVDGAQQLLSVAFEHRFVLLANALGPMPEDVVSRAHQRGIKTAALVGNVPHALSQVKRGVDIIVAQGAEAGGHCGDISTMVLVPDVVDAVGDRPVLAAGGIGCGRQVAAALALGAAGVWTGSIWLTTTESELPPLLREKMLQASATDTVRSRAMSGKPVRQLRTAWTDAWESADSPGILPSPLQLMLYASAEERIERHQSRALAGEAVGQIVGRMNSIRSTRAQLFDLVTEAVEAIEDLGSRLA